MTRRILEIIGTLDGGAEARQLLSLARGLPRDAFDVHVASLASGPLAREFEGQGIPLTVLGNSRRLDAGVWLRLRQHIKQLRPDAVHTWGGTANTFGRAAAISAGSRSIVSSGYDAPQSWLHASIDRWLACRTERVIVDTETLARRCKSENFEANICVIPPGVEPAETSDCSRDKLIADLGLPPGARLCAVVAPLVRSSQIKDLIWATDLVKVIREDAHMLVIGQGSQRASLERYRRLCHIDDKVHFLGYRHDLPSLIPHFDLVWRADQSESLSLVALEAMAAGVPVVLTDTAANRELVTHGETGFLNQPGDRAGFGRHANKILSDSALAQRMGAAAREHIANNFSAKSMVASHATVYGELTG